VKSRRRAKHQRCAAGRFGREACACVEQRRRRRRHGARGARAALAQQRKLFAGREVGVVPRLCVQLILCWCERKKERKKKKKKKKKNDRYNRKKKKKKVL
jgi:hypothetical protein